MDHMGCEIYRIFTDFPANVTLPRVIHIVKSHVKIVNCFVQENDLAEFAHRGIFTPVRLTRPPSLPFVLRRFVRG